jgi:hypothetical protein
LICLIKAVEMKTMRNNFRHRHENRICIKLLAAVVVLYLLMCLYAQVSDDDIFNRSNYSVVATCKKGGAE